MVTRNVLHKKDVWPAVAVFVAVAAVYLYGVRPAVAESDGGEFATFPGFLGVSHYPGYPLLNQLYYLSHYYTISPALAGGIFNALFAAAAAAVIYVAWRGWDIRRQVAAALALALPFTPAVWKWATNGPDAYTLELFLAAVVLALCRAAAARADFRFFAAATFVMALAAGNRITFGALAFVWLATLSAIPRRRLWPAALAGVTGISVYLYSVFRFGAFGARYEPALAATWDTTLGAVFRVPRYAAEVGRIPWESIPSNMIFHAKYGVVALAAAGAVAWARRPGGARWAAALFLSAVASLAVFMAYAVFVGGTPEAYLLLPLLLAFTFAAFGAEAVARLLGRWRWAAAAWTAAVVALPVYNIARNHGLGNHRGERGADAFTREATAVMAFESVVVGEHTNLMPVVYLHRVLRARPDQTVCSIDVSGWKDALRFYSRAGFPDFGPRGMPQPRRSLGGACYSVTCYPDSACNPDYVWVYVPAESLKRRLQTLPEGGRFAALIADSIPLAVAKKPHGGGPRAFAWRERYLQFPLQYRLGAVALVWGRRVGDGFDVVAAFRWGAGEGRCPGREAISFKAAGDAAYGMDRLELGVGDRAYRMASSGIIFVPLDARGRAAGPACYYPYGRHGYYILRCLAAERPDAKG